LKTYHRQFLLFWNSGNERIEKNDVAEKSPLRIEAKNGIKIFIASIINMTALENEFEIKINSEQNIVDCRFDYLSKNDGVTIQIIHSGRSSDELDFKGTIKDIGTPVNVTQKLDQSYANYNIILSLMGIGITFLLLILLSDYLHILGSLAAVLAIASIIIGQLIGRYLVNRNFLSSFFLFSSSPQYTHHKKNNIG